MRLSLFAPIDRWLAPAPGPGRVDWLRGAFFAHRGLHGADRPENSLAAFTAAAARGLGMECDVQLTADDEAVVFHDFTLDRMTGQRGAVVERTAAALSAIPLAGGGETIPSLRALLDVVAGRVPLLIELKSQRQWPISRLCWADRKSVV